MIEHKEYRQCRRCRTKLVEPTVNERSAFCCRGCFRIHYGPRCLVCERPKSRPQSRLCTRPSCRFGYAELKRHEMLGMWLGSPDLQAGSANPIKIGVPYHCRQPETYRQVAGPALTAIEWRNALNGADDVLRLNRRYVQEWNRAHPTLIGPTDMPINVLGGYQPTGKVP